MIGQAGAVAGQRRARRMQIADIQVGCYMLGDLNAKLRLSLVDSAAITPKGGDGMAYGCSKLQASLGSHGDIQVGTRQAVEVLDGLAGIQVEKASTEVRLKRHSPARLDDFAQRCIHLVITTGKGGSTGGHHIVVVQIAGINGDTRAARMAGQADVGVADAPRTGPARATAGKAAKTTAMIVFVFMVILLFSGCSSIARCQIAPRWVLHYQLKPAPTPTCGDPAPKATVTLASQLREKTC